MIQSNLPAPVELRLMPVDLPNVTIAIPATVSPWRDDGRYRFRLRLTEEDARTHETMRELVALRARGVTCLVSFGDRSLGPCVVELLTALGRVSPGEHRFEYRFELVLHRKKLSPASPEKDRYAGREEGRTLAPWAQELLGLPRVVPPWLETAIANAAEAFGAGPYQESRLGLTPLRNGVGVYREPCWALASLSMLPSAISHFAELARRLLADRRRDGGYLMRTSPLHPVAPR